MANGALTNASVIGVPITAIVGVVLFTLYAQDRYQSDLKAIEDSVNLRLSQLETKVNKTTLDRFTRGDFYVWCIRQIKINKCDDIIAMPPFAITGSPWITRTELLKTNGNP